MPDEVRLPPHPSSVGTARRFVTERLGALGVPDPGAGAELVVSELVTNAVIHAGTDLTVRVVAAEVGKGARIEVADGSSVMPGLRIANSRSHSGRGLMLVDHFASEWGVERTETGKIVWFIVRQEG